MVRWIDEQGVLQFHVDAVELHLCRIATLSLDVPGDAFQERLRSGSRKRDDRRG